MAVIRDRDACVTKDRKTVKHAVKHNDGGAAMSANPAIPERYANQQVGAIGYRVLNLDLDGVCADYTGAIRDYLVRHGQIGPATPSPSRNTS